MQDATQALEQFSPCASQGAAKPKDRRGGRRPNQTGRPPSRVVCYPPSEVMGALIVAAKKQKRPLAEVVAHILAVAASPYLREKGGTIEG